MLDLFTATAARDVVSALVVPAVNVAAASALYFALTPEVRSQTVGDGESASEFAMSEISSKIIAQEYGKCF